MRILIATLALVLLSNASGFAIENTNEWVRVQVGEIEVLTEADEDRAIDIAHQVALLKRSLRAHAIVEPTSERALRLYVFKDQFSLLPYAMRPNGPAAGFTTTDDITVMMAVAAHYNINTRQGRLYNVVDPFEIMAHEYVHAFLAEHAPRTPLWLSEGLSDFYSTYRADDEFVYIGLPIRRHQELLAKPGRNIPTARLILLDQSRTDYHGGAITSLTYAQCWATTHYLMTNKERRHGMVAYLRDLHDGIPELVSMDRNLAPYFPEQNVQLREYIGQDPVPHFRLKRKGDSDDVDGDPVKLDRATTLLRLGQLASGTGPTNRNFSVEHFEACLTEDPTMLDAWIGLAWISLFDDDWHLGQEQLAKVLEHDPTNLRARGLAGYAFMMENHTAISVGGFPAEVAEAREHLQAAMQGENPSPWYYYAYASSYAGEADKTPGVAAARTAIMLAPWEAHYYELLVDLYREAGELDTARQVLQDELFTRSLPVERFDTEMRLVEAEVESATQTWNAGQTDEASLALIRTLTPSEFVPVRQYIRVRMAELGIDIVYQRYVEILEMDNQGDHAEALSRLDAFVNDIDHPELEAMAAEFRQEVEQRISTD